MTEAGMIDVLTWRALEMATRRGQLDRWRSEVLELSKLDSATVAGLCRPMAPDSPEGRVQASERREGYTREVLEFVCAVVAEGHAHLLPAVAAEFGRRSDAYAGRTRARVTVAVPLDEETLHRIEDRLSEVTGRRTSVDVQVDPDIIGGLVLRVGDRLLDGSVRARLDSLRDALLSSADLS